MSVLWVIGLEEREMEGRDGDVGSFSTVAFIEKELSAEKHACYASKAVERLSKVEPAGSRSWVTEQGDIRVCGRFEDYQSATYDE